MPRETAGAVGRRRGPAGGRRPGASPAPARPPLTEASALPPSPHCPLLGDPGAESERPACTPHPGRPPTPHVASQPLPQLWGAPWGWARAPAAAASPSPHSGPQPSTRAGRRSRRWPCRLRRPGTRLWADAGPLPRALRCGVPAMRGVPAVVCAALSVLGCRQRIITHGTSLKCHSAYQK